MKGRAASKNSRWDLFLLLNRAPNVRSTKFLQPIPEEEEMSGHHCDRKLSDDIDTDLPNGHRTERDSGDTSPATKDHRGHHRIRRQWEATPPDQMGSIYRSLSTMEISPKSGRADEKRNHKLPSLPPLKSSGLKMSGLDRGARSSHRDPTDVDRRQRESSIEWVVTRPHKRRPKDVFTLEGVMDMKTTFASTYDVTAKELRKHLPPEPSNKPIVSCTTTYKDFVPTSRPSRRRRKERPKTTLKVGGEGNYRTVNRESFRNFVVVDDNNNNQENLVTESQNTTEAKMPDVAANEDGTHQCSPKSTLTPDSSLAHDDMVPQRSPSATNSVHEPLNQQRAGKEDESKDEKRRTNRETEGKAINEMTRDDDRNGRLESEWGAHEGLPEEDLLRGEKTMTVVRQKREVEIGGDGVRETRMPRSKSSSMQADEVRGRSAQKAESRSRHLSHPRTQHKHKNESQLRFDGTMDFETTTRRLYRNCEEKKERDGMRKRVTRARDLFKPSDEVDLFNSQRTDKFDGATTYALCFQNKQYCPVMDLDTSQSDYVFREETGSHKYYCSVSRLS